MKKTLLLTLLLLPVCFKSVQASQITFAFTGSIDFINFDGGGSPSEFVIGDTVEGSYTFDSTDQDVNVSINNGYYYNSITSLNFSINTYSAIFDSGIILVRDNVPVQDYYLVRSSDFNLVDGGGEILGMPLSSFSLEMHDYSGTVFTDDLLLVDPPILSNFDNNSMSIEFFDPFNGNMGFVDITLDSITLQSNSVPEPTVVWLLGAGLIGLVGTRKKSTKLSGKYA